MAREVAPRFGGLVNGRSSQYGVSREVQREIDGAVGRGLIGAAEAQAATYVALTRVGGAAMVAHLGMSHCAELTDEATGYCLRAPQGQRGAAEGQRPGDYERLTGTGRWSQTNQRGGRPPHQPQNEAAVAACAAGVTTPSS